MFRRRLSCRFATLTAPSRHASTVPSGVDTTPVAIEPTLDATLDDETRHALLRIKPETPQRYLVEVANVSSAACRFCGLPVVSESLRIGALISSGSGDFTFPSFIHAECLTGGYRRAYPGAMRDWRLISGVARLPPSDIARVVDIVFGADHVIDPKQAKLLTKQSAALSMAEAALRDASAKEIAAMLVDVYGKPADKVFNMHPKGPSKPLVLSVLADALVFGPVEPCDACGSICKPTARGYECLGYIDEYTRCTNSRPTVKRLAGNAKWTALTKRFAVGHITDDCILHPRVLDAKSKPVEALATLPADSIDVFDGLHFDGFSPKDIAGLVSHGGNMIGKSDTRALPAHVVRRGPQASKSYKSIPATAPTVSDGWVHHCSKVGTTIHSPTAHKFFTANGPKKDPAEDLEKYIKLQRALHEEQVAKKTPNTTGAKERNVVVSSSGVAVDSEVPNAASYRVVVGSGGVPFHASLTKTDLASGRNSFYVLQLLVETTTNRYLVWRRWGRVGELIGGSKLEAGSETDFAKLFHERTGNNWPPNNFQKKAGLMDMVHVDYSVPSDDKGKKTNGKKGAKATGGGDGDGTGTGGGILLDKPTRSLMQLMFNKDIIVETMQMMKIDTEKLPLGNLSTTTLEQGSAILLEIQKLVNGAQQAGTKKNSKTNKGTDGTVDFTNAQKQQLLSLSNRFYSKVPQRIERGADASIAILDDMNKIAAQADLLRDLLDIVQTKNILDMSQQSTDPAAAHLQSLSTKFEHLPRGPELDAVRQYFTSTRGSTHDAFELLDVWRIARCNEAERFKPWSDDTNRKLLWHGSRLTNWVAILTQGLRIAPPEAPVSGYMFGKGIYFADMMSKSANYCRLYGATHGLMALAEVSLGKPHVLYDSDSSLDLHAMKKFGCRSTFALGRDGPAAFAPFPHLPGCTQGLQVPVYSRGDSTKVDDGGGASRRSRSLMYNEYIVYDVAQVHLRYLLRIKQA